MYLIIITGVKVFFYITQCLVRYSSLDFIRLHRYPTGTFRFSTWSMSTVYILGYTGSSHSFFLFFFMKLGMRQRPVYHHHVSYRLWLNTIRAFLSSNTQWHAPQYWDWYPLSWFLQRYNTGCFLWLHNFDPVLLKKFNYVYYQLLRDLENLVVRQENLIQLNGEA